MVFRLRPISVFKQLLNEDGEIVSSGQDEHGRELPDGTPMALPVGMSHHATLADMIRRMIHHQKLAEAAAAEGFDTPEEADDFDVEDDVPDPETPYERHFMPPPRTEVLDPNVKPDKTSPPSNDFEEEEVQDGNAESDKGRSAPGGRRSGRARAERESEPGAERDADDEGGVRETDPRDRRRARENQRR